MLFEVPLRQQMVDAMQTCFGVHIEPADIQLQRTHPDFEGDLTLVVFPLAKHSRTTPQETARLIGEYLLNHSRWIESFHVVKGFLNLVIKDQAWLEHLGKAIATPNYGYSESPREGLIVIEYSSPNTNKPLHLGHIRNNLLGWSLAAILKAAGYSVKKVNLVNDRGIHICKSMLAWKKWGNGETPQSSGMKGDHLAGKYYVLFEQKLQEEIHSLIQSGLSPQEAEARSQLMEEVREMLRLWEAGHSETIHLWKQMNNWVYEGFDITYKRLGVDFDKIYYESDTYLVGKQIVEEGLKRGIFRKRADGSVIIDLTDEGLDEKVLLRRDGTAVYMTQDIGTAWLRYQDFKFSKMIYVVGNEQDYHFKVLKRILEKLGYPWSQAIYHLSYGMVDLPSGKMKSREGTVVDADDLLDELIKEAEKVTRQLGKIEDFTSHEAERLYQILGLGALKYFLLRVDPEKRMLFNPSESIDFNGDTGPFVQYTYARIQSVLRKAGQTPPFNQMIQNTIDSAIDLNREERALIAHLLHYPDVICEAAERLSPSLIAHYVYTAARLYNHFYHYHTIVDSRAEATSFFRIQLSRFSAQIIHSALGLLGIECPERM
jgi:arginyl-tRNA synthetase